MDNEIKISDLVIETLQKEGVNIFFGVTGGAVVHFFDSISKRKGVSSIFFNHEQSAAFAVEAYAKSKKGIGAGIFTTGPGATNALTGLAAAWLDSIPCVFISGQSRTTSTIGQRNLRQVGTQEVNIVEMVKPITKYAVTVRHLHEVKYHLHKAIFLARHGRAGPVWIDIPVDISWSSIIKTELKDFDSKREYPTDNSNALNASLLKKLQSFLNDSKRPLLVIGQGARLAGVENELKEIIEKFSIPFVTTWSMCDFLESDHLLNIGRLGISGQRGANLAVQNCDTLICIGTHLNNSITGTLFDAFAREAKVVVVNIDKDEIDNIPVKVDLKINCDVKDFLIEFSSLGKLLIKNKTWLTKCISYSELNDFSEKYADIQEGINSLYFKKVISDKANENTIFVTDGGGTNVYSSFQACFNKKNQKLILSTGICSMGSGLPEAIGVYFANPECPIICFIGDGSFPFNMQEFQLVKDLKLPIKFFILNNNGYTSIKTTQADFLGGNFIGSSPDAGIHLIDIEKAASCFGIDYCLLNNNNQMMSELDKILDSNEAIICEIILSNDEIIEPRQGYKPSDDGFLPQPLEDMYPFLDETLFDELMIVNPWKKQKIIVDKREVDLLKKYPKPTRPIHSRGKRKLSGKGYIDLEPNNPNNTETIFEQLLLKKAKEFGDVYFDGDRLFGYGGYEYDIKYWNEVAKDIISYYKLKPGDKVLEIGCAKGFLLHDLCENLPGLIVKGLDLSDYAKDNAIPEVKDMIEIGDASNLPFKDNEFDLVLAINTLSELDERSCRKALKEIERVKIKNSFITLNSWSDEESRKRFTQWNITGSTNFSKKAWLKVFEEESYTGNYNWFIL
jgi:acetolactate synthase I/II/III large subunit